MALSCKRTNAENSNCNPTYHASATGSSQSLPAPGENVTVDAQFPQRTCKQITPHIGNWLILRDMKQLGLKVSATCSAYTVTILALVASCHPSEAMCSEL